MTTVWVVQEFEAVTGHERQGRPDRLISTGVYKSEQLAQTIAARLMAGRLGRFVTVTETLLDD